MKKNSRIILSVFAAVLLCAACFIGISAVMLASGDTDVNTPLNNMPYSNAAPLSLGLLFCFDDGGSIFCEFDAVTTKTSVILLKNGDGKDQLKPYGYTADFVFDCEYSVLECLIDNLGGIDMDNYHYTGVQISEILRHTAEISVRKRVVSAVFGKISAVGLSSQALVDLIEQSSTDFSFPDGYSLLALMPALCQNIVFIN